VTEVPPLIEILKTLGGHRWELWEKNYGKLEQADNLESLLQESLQLLLNNQTTRAGTAFAKFVVATGRRLDGPEEKELRRRVAAVVRASKAAIRENRPDKIPTLEDFGPIVKKAHRQFERLRSYRPSEKADAAYHNHPLLKVCVWVEENTGITREQVEQAARRLNTDIGLREWKRQNGELRPDCLWMIEKFNALDASGRTEALWHQLKKTDARLLRELGLVGLRSPSAAGAITTQTTYSPSTRAIWVLEALNRLKAVSPETNKPLTRIAKVIDNDLEPSGLKRAVSEVRGKKWVAAVRGRGGGYFLTKQGLNGLSRRQKRLHAAAPIM
jgi:hypothetical protein